MADIKSASWTGALSALMGRETQDEKIKRAEFEAEVLSQLALDKAGTRLPQAPENFTYNLATDSIVIEKPKAEPEPEPAPIGRFSGLARPVASTLDFESLTEYDSVAESIGFVVPELRVERFKNYLRASGITVFALDEVVKFMDAKSKAEGSGWGWNWRPLRAKDAQTCQAGFGRPAQRANDFAQMRVRGLTASQVEGLQNAMQSRSSPASNHYAPSNAVYSLPVPLHALKKVAKIEKEFKGAVSFAISDYAPAPEFKVDPFLLCILGQNEAKFVIDVWDEPGFGVEQMLKSDL